MFTSKIIVVANVFFSVFGISLASAQPQITEQTIEHKASSERLWKLDRILIKSYQPHGRQGLSVKEARATLELIYSILYTATPQDSGGGPYREPAMPLETELGQQVDRMSIELYHGETLATDRTTILVQARGSRESPHVAFKGILQPAEYRGLAMKIGRNAKILELRAEELASRINRLSQKIRESVKELEQVPDSTGVVKSLKSLNEQLRRAYYGGVWGAFGSSRDGFDPELLARKVESDRDHGRLLMLNVVDGFRVASEEYHRIVMCPSYLVAQAKVNR